MHLLSNLRAAHSLLRTLSIGGAEAAESLESDDLGEVANAMRRRANVAIVRCHCRETSSCNAFLFPGLT
jgi:hypothetical protein